MEMKKHIVLINANAHTRKIKKLLAEMEDTFRKQHFSYAFYTTKDTDNAIHIMQTQKEPCRFYICGGDGTLHQAVHTLLHTAHEVVLLPCGTGNDFSRMLYDHKDVFAHFRKSLNQQAQAIDILQVNDTQCINAACFALDHDIANHVHDTNWHLIPRKLAYLMTVLRRIFVYSYPILSITLDGGKIFEGKAIFATCNNARFYGGGFCMTPNALLQDGKMDICIIEGFSRWKIIPKCPALLTKQPQKLKECHLYQGKEAIIHTNQGVNLDGEIYQDQDVYIKVLPQAFQLVNELKSF